MAVSVRRRFDFGGGNPMVFFEGITEMPDILIAQQVGCFINLAVGSKQFPGLIHFQPGDIGDIGLACLFFKQGAEVGWIDIEIAGDGIQGQVVHDMVGYKLQDLLDTEAGIGTGQVEVVQGIKQPCDKPFLQFIHSGDVDDFMHLKTGLYPFQL